MISSPQTQNFQLLLEVFQRGLKIGLISREEIIAWADNIIATTYEPDYFFIELSLSSDANTLLEVLNRHLKPTNDPVCDRVLLALVYHRKPIFEVRDVENVAALVGSMTSWDTLTNFENATICTFDDYYVYYLPDLAQLQVEISNFLGIYKAFTLENYEEWLEINEQVLQLLKEEEIKANAIDEKNRKAWAKQERKTKLKLFLKRLGVFLLVLIMFGLFYSLFHNSQNIFFFYFFLCYILVRVGYVLWRRRRT